MVCFTEIELYLLFFFFRIWQSQLKKLLNQYDIWFTGTFNTEHSQILITGRVTQGHI